MIYNTILSSIGVLNNHVDYSPCSLNALRAINAVGAPACLYYAFNHCQQQLLFVSFQLQSNFYTVKL